VYEEEEEFLPEEYYEGEEEWDNPFGFEEYEDPGAQGLVPYDEYNQMADPAYLLAARRAVEAAAALRAFPPAPQAPAAAAGAPPNLNPQPAAEAEDGAYNDLLGGHVSLYEDKVGLPLLANLANHIVTIWGKGKYVARIKEISTRQLVPSNIPMRTVDVNPEILPNLGKYGLARDRRLNSLGPGTVLLLSACDVVNTNPAVCLDVI
jgi:hypothetical protein